MYSMLICDDENYILEMLSKNINWKSINVEVKDTAINGQVGLNKFKMSQFDILLLDIRMPIMSGIEMAKKVREIDKKVQIIFLTSLEEFEYAQVAVKLNACGYILKPFSQQELIETVKIAVERIENGATFKKVSEPDNGEMDFIAKNVNKYIEEHLSKKISLKEIAEHFSYSTNYLGQLYKKSTGMFVNEYILKARMDKAAMLLEVPQNQIGTIAEILGYNDLAYFIKQFKEYYGVTPKAFRDSNNK